MKICEELVFLSNQESGHRRPSTFTAAPCKLTHYPQACVFVLNFLLGVSAIALQLKTCVTESKKFIFPEYFLRWHYMVCFEKHGDWKQVLGGYINKYSYLAHNSVHWFIIQGFRRRVEDTSIMCMCQKYILTNTCTQRQGLRGRFFWWVVLITDLVTTRTHELPACEVRETLFIITVIESVSLSVHFGHVRLLSSGLFCPLLCTGFDEIHASPISLWMCVCLNWIGTHMNTCNGYKVGVSGQGSSISNTEVDIKSFTGIASTLASYVS